MVSRLALKPFVFLDAFRPVIPTVPRFSNPGCDCLSAFLNLTARCFNLFSWFLPGNGSPLILSKSFILPKHLISYFCIFIKKILLNKIDKWISPASITRPK